MGAMLIRNGHMEVRKYRVNFFNICLEELSNSKGEKIRYNAIASKIAMIEGDEFGKVLDEVDPKPKIKKPKVVVDHLAQMRESSQG